MQRKNDRFRTSDQYQDSSRLFFSSDDYFSQNDASSQQSFRSSQDYFNSQRYYNNNKYQQYQTNYQNYAKQEYSKQSLKTLDSANENASNSQNRSASVYRSNSMYSINRQPTDQYTNANQRLNREGFRGRSFQGGDYKRRAYQTDVNNSSKNQENRDTIQTQKQEDEMKVSAQEEMLINFADYDEHGNELYYKESEIVESTHQEDETFVDFVSIEIKCFNCNDVFLFRFKLHKHLRSECIKNHSKPLVEFEVSAMLAAIEISSNSKKMNIVSSTVSTKNKEFELAFRN